MRNCQVKEGTTLTRRMKDEVIDFLLTIASKVEELAEISWAKLGSVASYIYFVNMINHKINDYCTCGFKNIQHLVNHYNSLVTKETI